MSDASRWQPKPIYRCPVCGVHSTAPGRCRCTPKRRPGRVSPTDRAVTAEQARRPLQTSKKEEK